MTKTTETAELEALLTKLTAQIENPQPFTDLDQLDRDAQRAADLERALFGKAKIKPDLIVATAFWSILLAGGSIDIRLEDSTMPRSAKKNRTTGGPQMTGGVKTGNKPTHTGGVQQGGQSDRPAKPATKKSSGE